MSLRRTLGRVPFARNAWHLARELKNVVAYGAARARADFEQEFAGARDPWSFETDPVAGHHRFNRELALLEAVRGGRRFTRALEVGCAEGMFTERLAPLCGELLAVDISPVALPGPVRAGRGAPMCGSRIGISGPTPSRDASSSWSWKESSTASASPGLSGPPETRS